MLVHGRRMAFCNNAAVHSRRRHLVHRLLHESTASTAGRPTWSRTPAPDGSCAATPDGSLEVVLDGLRFANGVALSADESYVAVAETAGRTVVRRWLTGPRAGERDLPRRRPARLPRQHQPRQRRAGLGHHRLPDRPGARAADARAQAAATARLAAARAPPTQGRSAPSGCWRFDDARPGRARLLADADGYHMVTGVREHQGRVWLGSLEEPAVAVFDAPVSKERVDG